MRKIEIVVQQDKRRNGEVWIRTVGMASLGLPELVMTRIDQSSAKVHAAMLSAFAETMIVRAGTRDEVTRRSRLPLKVKCRACGLIIDKSEDPKYQRLSAGRVWKILPVVDFLEEE